MSASISLCGSISSDTDFWEMSASCSSEWCACVCVCVCVCGRGGGG